MDLSDLRKLKRFQKNAPREFRAATAGVLNSLAFSTRKLDIENISRSMIIRNRRFVEGSLKVDKARRGPIESQIAIEGSINRPRFTGWKEQQTGAAPKKKRTATIHSRKGSKRRQMLARARLKPGNKFYKPEQFQGKSLQRKFYFMMRVLGSRGGGEFLLSRSVPLKSGSLRRGLYSLRKSKIKRLQGFEGSAQPRRNPWHGKSLRMLSARNDMRKVWQQNIDRVVRKYN
jgi:hypothetical protein